MRIAALSPHAPVFRQAVVSLVLALAVSGCAFGTRTVTLKYVPPASERPTESRGAFAIVPFVDGRTAARNVGSEMGRVKNGYGMVTASVHATSDPAAWAGDSIAGGLTERGYRLQVGALPPAEAAEIPVLAGTLVEAFCDMEKGYLDATVQVDVTLTRGDERLLATSCVGRDRARTWLGWSSDFQDRLQAAMQQAAASCATKLSPYLTQKP